MKENQYDLMLFAAFEGILVPRTSIRTLFDSQITFNIYVQRAIDEQTLKEYVIESRHGKCSRTVKCLGLTPKGLSYLYKNYGSFFYGIEQTVIDNSAPFGNTHLNTDAKAAAAKDAGAAIMSFAAGAQVCFPLSQVQDNLSNLLSDRYWNDQPLTERVEVSLPEGKYRYSELLTTIAHRQEETKFQRQNLNGISFDISSSDYIAYINRRSLKYMIRVISGNGIAFKDVDRARNNGLLQSHFRSVLLFENFTSGFRWTDNFINADMLIYENWGQTLKDGFRLSSAENKNCAAILVDNPKHFVSVFLDQPGVRRAEFTKEGRRRIHSDILGHPFDHFYAIPTNRRGANLLRNLMLHADMQLREETEEILCTEGKFRRNEGDRQNLFPVILRSDDGVEIPCMLLNDLCIRKIQILQRYIRDEESRCAAACEMWQTPFLRSVLKQEILKGYVEVVAMADSKIDLPEILCTEKTKPDLEENPVGEETDFDFSDWNDLTDC